MRGWAGGGRNMFSTRGQLCCQPVSPKSQVEPHRSELYTRRTGNAWLPHTLSASAGTRGAHGTGLVLAYIVTAGLPKLKGL